MAIDLGYRRKKVATLTNQIGCYVLCDLDQVPLYVGHVRRRMIWNSRADFVADGLGSSGSGYAA